MELVSLEEEERPEVSISIQRHRGRAMRRHSKKETVYNQEAGSYQELNLLAP